MNRLLKATILAIAPFSLGLDLPTSASAQSLYSFGVLAGSTITNTGASVINGNIGLSPGSAITGFPPGTVTAPYAIYQTDGAASLAQSDLTTAYNILAGQPATADLTGQNLGGKTLTAGVYNFNTTAQLTGNLVLNAQGNSNAVFIFNIGSALTTASGSTITLINGALGSNVYFRVGSSATLGSDSLFAGEILALTSITLVTGTDIDCGGALARNGAVTLDTNTITVCTVPTTTATSVLGSSASPTTSAVAAAIDAFVAGGGSLPLAFQVLTGVLSSSALGASLGQLSGEAGTGAAPAAAQAMNSFMSSSSKSSEFSGFPNR